MARWEFGLDTDSLLKIIKSDARGPDSPGDLKERQMWNILY
jgi:hypothetical protein